MGRKCSVDGCLSDSNRNEDAGVTFHKVPVHSDIRPKWFSLCHIPEDKKNLKVIYVCSRHFLRADFCNFKGKKYMLRQGVLPSVFPWDKSKLQAIKVKRESAEENVCKIEPEDSSEEVPTLELKAEDESDVKPDISMVVKSEPMETEEPIVVKNEEVPKIISEEDIKVEEKDISKKEEMDKIKCTSASGINFSINSKLEALDFNNMWYPAKIVEVDYEENEVLIHFEKFSSKYDEWICMDSPRLRPLLPPGKNPAAAEQFAVGEKCMAAWSDSRKFPATVTRILEKDVYEVLFDDGFVKTVKGHRMSKSQGKQMQTSPLFDPIKSTKQERRDKKRRINVAALFCKRSRVGGSGDDKKPPPVSVDTSVVEEEPPREPWMPVWENGRPIGTEAIVETNDGPRNSVIVPDHRLPSGWVKHLMQRVHGTSAGKWDTIIVGPDNKRFRTKSEIKSYLEHHPGLGDINEMMFDFSLHRQRQKKKIIPPADIQEPGHEDSYPEEAPKEENPNALKIEFIDNAFKCPIEGCGKNFRKENLAQMHVKHYHKEYTKYLDSTPNVADLAYARTVGENLEKSPGPPKQTPTRSAAKITTPKAPKVPLETELKCQVGDSTNKDSEIIKLLSSKPFDKDSVESIRPIPSGLPSNMYPDIKLKDLLVVSEAVPKRDDINMKTLCSTRPPIGIKTLLPVRAGDSSAKRKRGFSENEKGNPLHPPPPPPQPPITDATLLSPLTQLNTEDQFHPHHPPNNDTIIEGGEVIKIVRMKQEEIINCTCGFTEEDGLMIQCELCLCWQHAYCNNIERESQVPEKYVCYICLNPVRERASMRHAHDQDWLKQGALPAAGYHSKDEEAMQKRFEKLKKLHDISGALGELREFQHSLSVKLKIAGAKNHPKLYLWSKPWDKPPLPEKADLPKDNKDDIKLKTEEPEDVKLDSQNDSMLMMILKGKGDITNLVDSNAPIIPRPEAAIDSADCKFNLLEHIAHAESLIDERLSDFEKIVEGLEEGMNIETDENYPKTRQTLQMLMKDIGVLGEFSQLTTL
ncbi:unnamed protein product [Brassicogethes aeneus]|uniref:PHD finger protein 20 n=1 Tax=Brassicogethes aeneus TaxID=1431903 RepID=A0A9P0B866_BRAAE|nr:unnamed protein product [Brassicogethes aeneus]